MDRQYRVTLIRRVETELSVAVFAESPEAAKREALDLATDDGSQWTVVNRETSASAEEDPCR